MKLPKSIKSISATLMLVVVLTAERCFVSLAMDPILSNKVKPKKKKTSKKKSD